MRIQRDVHLAAALAQRDAVLAWLRQVPPQAHQTRQFRDALEIWDGNYDAQSPGANAFELLFFHLARELVPAKYRSAYDAAWGTRALIWEDVMAAPARTRLPALRRAARKAARDFERGTMWGERHRLRLAHPFGLIPLIGRRYRFADLPAPGTSETLMKTAHGPANRRHGASYGSVARHISDLSDPDANYFALLGGQDGWFGSANFTDPGGVMATRRFYCAALACLIGGQEFSPPHRPSAWPKPVIDGTPFLRLYARRRGATLQHQDPAAGQERQLVALVRHAENTRFGREHSFAKIKTIADFQARVPLRRYEDMWRDYWQPEFPRLADCTWPGTISYFALSSGTTSGATKYIPCSREMNRANDRAALDVLAHHITNRPSSRVLGGKSFMLGGSTELTELAPGIHAGDLSGIAAARVPFWARPYIYPPRELCAHRRLEKKIELLSRAPWTKISAPSRARTSWHS